MVRAAAGRAGDRPRHTAQVALHNDADQFAVYLKPRIEAAIVERHQADGELFEAHFDSAEGRDLIDQFLIRRAYEAIRAS